MSYSIKFENPDLRRSWPEKLDKKMQEIAGDLDDRVYKAALNAIITQSAGSLITLPDEIQLMICKELDLPSFKNLRSCSLYWDDFGRDPQTWRVIAKELDCPLNEKSSLSDFDQVDRFIQKKLANAKISIGSGITEIDEIYHSDTQLTIDHLKLLIKCEKACSTLRVWRKIAEALVPNANTMDIFGVDEDYFKSAKNCIEKSEKFKDWALDNQNELAQIRFLSLEEMGLAFLPKEIGYLTGLTFINLRDNLLTSLPESFGNLTQLFVLTLSNNQLRTLPKTFCNLKRLMHLHLSNNRLRSLSKDFCKLAELRYLDVRENRLTTLPNDMGNLSKLKKLILSLNKFEVLPGSLKNLTALKNLDLSFNFVSSIPDCFPDELEILNLTGNPIRTLPDSFQSLKLKELVLMNTPLKTLPKVLLKLKHLKKVELHQVQKDVIIPEKIEDTPLNPAPAWLVNLVFKKNMQQQKGLLSTEFFIPSQVKALAKVALPAVSLGVLSLFKEL